MRCRRSRRVLAVHAGLDAGVAGGGRRGVRAVAVVVARRVVLVRVGTDQRPVRVEHLAGAEQLVVARERCVVGIVGGVAEVAVRAPLASERWDRRAPYVPSSAKLGCSGQMPLSMTPTTTSSPVRPVVVRATLAGEAEVLAAGVGRELPQLVGEYQCDSCVGRHLALTPARSFPRRMT